MLTFLLRQCYAHFEYALLLIWLCILLEPCCATLCTSSRWRLMVCTAWRQLIFCRLCLQYLGMSKLIQWLLLVVLRCVETSAALALFVQKHCAEDKYLGSLVLCAFSTLDWPSMVNLTRLAFRISRSQIGPGWQEAICISSSNLVFKLVGRSDKSSPTLMVCSIWSIQFSRQSDCEFAC